MGSDVGFSDYPAAWTLMTLGDLLDLDGGSVQTGPFGSQLHAADYVSEGIPSVMPKNISIEGINESDIARITEEDALRLSKYLMAEGDIVYSRRGDVEKCALVKEHESGWLCGTGCLRVRLNKDSRITPNYLHAYLSSPEIREWVSRNAIGATMPNLNTSILRDIPVLVPEERDIKFTSNIWNDLNSKIQLNRKTNKTLEAMAQALFKSWFVDFDPVIDNALAAGNEIPEPLQARAAARKAALAGLPKAQRELFPCEFEETEALGWVPKGWEQSSFAKHTVFKNGFAFKSKELVKDIEDNIPVFKMGHIKRGGGFNPNGTKSYFPKSCVDTKIQEFFAKKGDLLMSMTDMKSNMVILGNTALMPISDKFLVNQRVGRIRSNTSTHLDYPYLYFYTNHTPVVEELRSRANSGVQVNLSTAAIKETLLLVPSEEVHHEFDKQVKAFLERIFANDESILSLEKLRDTLLPKLISGELRLPDAEKQAEALVK